MEEDVEARVAAAAKLHWTRFLVGVAVVLSLPWFYYFLRELLWRVRPWLEATFPLLPDSVVKLLTGLSGYVLIPVAVLVFFVLALRIGFWLDVRRLAAPRTMLEAYREATRQGTARWQEHVENVLRNAGDLPPEELAQLRADLEETGRRALEDAARKEKLYAENPALLENEVRMTMESIQAKERAGGL